MSKKYREKNVLKNTGKQMFKKYSEPIVKNNTVKQC